MKGIRSQYQSITTDNKSDRHTAFLNQHHWHHEITAVKKRYRPDEMIQESTILVARMRLESENDDRMYAFFLATC